MAKFKSAIRKNSVANELLNDASRAQLAEGDAPEIVFIPLDNLVPSALNTYPITDIDGLALSILAVGRIAQPLEVLRLDGSELGKFKIISGERRFQASRLLVGQGHKEYGKAPCIIRKLEELDAPGLSDEEKEKLLIHTTNADNRQLDGASLIPIVEELTRLYTTMRDNGKDFGSGVKIREVVSQKLNISTGQVGKAKFAAEHLAPEVKEQLAKNGDVSLNIADKLAHQPEDVQKAILKNIPDLGELTASKIEELAEKRNEQKAEKKAVKTLQKKADVTVSDNLPQFDDVVKSIADITERLVPGITLNASKYGKLLAGLESVSKKLDRIAKLIS